MSCPGCCLGLLLSQAQNMVGPGEVDDDLQPEVTEECTKFGKVINCLVFEVCVLPHV